MGIKARVLEDTEQEKQLHAEQERWLWQKKKGSCVHLQF